MINDEEIYSTVRKYGLSNGVVDGFNDLKAEIDKLGKEIERGAKPNKYEFALTPRAISEMGLCLFSILALCEEMQIDPNKAIGMAVNRHEIENAEVGTLNTQKLIDRVHGI